MDKEIVCVGCRETFVFTEGEQEFFRDKGYTEPKRCQPCRRAKKQRYANEDAQPVYRGDGEEFGQ